MALKKLVFLLALALPLPAVGGDGSFLWRSRASTAAGLSLEIEQLYLTLYNTGNLVVRQTQIGQPAFVERLLRDEGAFHGAHFPMSIDAMLCDLNPGVCRRSKQAVSTKDLSDPVAHVGGYTSSRGSWRLAGGELVTIPDYGFNRVTTLVRIPAPDGWTVKSFAADPGMDCSAWGKTCEEVVREFNPRLLKSTKAGMTITVPRLQLETELLLRPDASSELLQRLQSQKPQVAASEEAIVVGPDFAPADGWSDTWNNQLSRQSPADLTFQSIRNNLSPLGSIQLQGVEDEPLVGDQMELFRVIHHPFAELRELGSPYDRPVDIVVIDAPLGAGHCDLPDLRAADGSMIPLPETPDGAGCDQMNPAALSDADHAAAVAGVIAAPQNGVGTVGLNPNARLWMMGLDRNADVDSQIGALIRQIQLDIPKEARVANLSFGMRPLLVNPADVRDAMAIHGSRMLIVAAAGNEGLELSGENCPILPACLNDLENVITVVGLDGDFHSPKVWRSNSASSNRSPRFDIGAPALDILTTVTDNSFALQKGTSFAAPQVTATASLIFAAGEFIYGDELGEGGGQLSPKIVKDRLSYTADFFPGLSGALLAGRLNVGRAIRLNDAQFELFDGRTIIGQVLEAPDTFVCRSPQESQRFQRWYNVRRMGWNEAKGRHFLFKHTGNDLGGRYGPLERFPSCLVQTLSANVTVRTRNADDLFEEVSFQFRDIRDYTSPLFDE